jgi:hypothetical protein
MRQEQEQNRACSRRGVNSAPHCAQFRVSLTQIMLRERAFPWAADRLGAGVLGDRLHA